MKKFRKVYEAKAAEAAGLDPMYIPSESDFEEFEKGISVDIKEADGCKVEFIFHNSELIGAICNDPNLGLKNEILDMDNTKMAYSDFNSWLNA